MKTLYLTACAVLLCLGHRAHAQYELRAGSFNTLYQGGPPAVGSPVPTGGQSSSVYVTSGGAGAITTSTVLRDRFPSNGDGSFILESTTAGTTFAVGVPRYGLGEEILPPLTKNDSVTPAPPGYWRAQPVLPGEIIPGLGALIPTSTVVVTSAETISSTVLVSSVPPALTVGATLLGQPVTRIVGTTITLAGNSNTTINGSSTVTITPPTSFYYSPHAEKVFAHQAGRVEIKWVSRQLDGGSYRIMDEVFAVSSNTSLPIRTIFWTEGTFDGPKVEIKDGRITTVSPIYNVQVPKAVPEEIRIPGNNPPSPNLTTLSFDKFNGVGQLHAYNVEGRLLVEYLGNVRSETGAYDHVGREVVELKRVAPVGYPPVNLGSEILPGNGNPNLIAAPVLSSQQSGTSYYGTRVRPDQSITYYAERETSPSNMPDDGSPLNPNDAYNKVVFYWLENADFNIKWPTHQDRYWLRWSPDLNDYAHYTVDPAGSTPATGISFSGGALPQLVYQDDPAQSEAVIDTTTQRFHVTPGSDQRNRALLKFATNGSLWYVNIYTQTENRTQTLLSNVATVDLRTVVDWAWWAVYPGQTLWWYNFSTSDYGFATVAEVVANSGFRLTSTLPVGAAVYTPNWAGFLGWARNPVAPSASTVTVASTAGLEVGMVVTGPGITGTQKITRIISGTQFELSTYLPSTATLNYTVESDAASVINTSALVGTRLSAPAGHEPAGFISGGTGYYPQGYLNPFTIGVEEANRGAIIPVNALPGNNQLTVRWFKRVPAPGPEFQDLYVPGKTGRYTVTFPAATAPQIIIAQGVGTDDLPPAESTGSVYTQNDSAAPGFNPNEEHAFMLGGRAYALRDDLNVAATSEPCVLLAYTDPTDDRPAMHAYRVVRTSPQYDFDYISTAGTLLVKPYPLPLMPLPLVPTGVGSAVRSKDLEIYGTDSPANHHADITADTAYSRFTFQDRKGFTWVHRGPHVDVPSEPTGGKIFTGGDAGEGLDLDGTFAYAFNVGTLGPAGQVRDASFTDDHAPGITVTAPNEIPGWHGADYGTSPGDDALEFIMQDIRWAAEPGTVSVDLANMQPGRRYKIQLLFADNGTGRGFDVRVEGQTVGDNFRPGLVNGGSPAAGTVFSHEFNAQDTTLNIVLDGVPTDAADKNPILSGVTVELLPVQPILTMKLYYVSREGFYIPGMANQPPVGTILPFLRQPGRNGTPLVLNDIDSGETDEPLPIIYRPTWPEQAPELRVGETLALPKFGLPQVRGQASAQVLYQQSIARDATNSLIKNSVTLHDPTREKIIALDAPGIALTAVPASIATTSYRGKTYFQRLAPHLQKRVFIDPIRGPKGTLIMLGEFHDEIAGEDYLDLNLLTEAEEATLKALATSTDPNKSKWDAAIDALNTRVETFKENPALAGTWIVDSTKNQDVGENELAKISHPDTAVDSYAVTATGQGTGFVTMVFGNGRSPQTPEGDPVQVKVFKVAPQLYTGDLKVVASSNPMDEQVTLRHSGDFAGRPEDYEFDWRWTTGAATAPAVYTTVMQTRLGNSNQWRIVSDPGAMRGAAAEYAANVPVTLPRSIVVAPAEYSAEDKAAGYPALVMKSETAVDFSSGVPGDIFFSADTGSLDGFVLYVNGVPAVASNAPTPLFTLTNGVTGLTVQGLPQQFRVPSSYFSAARNIIEIAVYSRADANFSSSLNFRLEAAQETDAVSSGAVWQTASDPQQLNTNNAIVGGSPLNPFGGSTFVLNDRWFTMRYRPKASANNVLGTPWSRWMPPQFVEGWVKRVLAAINPFEQRVKDLYNSGVNTDISVLTQAGKRWEGDIALTLGNINDVGLIEIYETVLNRAKSMSIDANTNDPDTNNALLLAAGYLNDLYTLLGNEAYADAANPTISVEEQGLNAATEINTSRFSFEGQVSTSLDEELALLRGRDDSVSPGVNIAPGYNRLYWNYTRGINSGEAIYALNYNIKEKVGSSTADGVIDEADAQRMFPQGHGDSYGHYLTALTGYYKLITNPNFTWTPRAEAVTVLGQPVTVDYFDERKFAAAAGNIARAAEQILALTWRKVYVDDPAMGWEHLGDRQPANPQTNVTPSQGMDEWASRSTQGALYHWAVANAVLPVEDNVHTGIQKIDRTTVPELGQLATAAATFQTTMDNANAHLNPLGLSPGAIAFDIAPAKILIDILEGGGASHYQQIAERALTALNNAAGAFNRAASMTGSLRNQENSLDELNTAIVEQERGFRNELIDVFGRPYTGEIGAGKLYAQGYEGPDLFHWYIVDRPNNLVNTSLPVTLSIKEATGFAAFTGNSIADIVTGLDATSSTTVVNRTVTVNPSQFVQYNDVWQPGGLGGRAETGELQEALLDAQQTLLAVSEFKTSYLKENANLRQQISVFNDLVTMHQRHLSEVNKTHTIILVLESVKLALETTAATLDALSETSEDIGDTLAEFFPRSVGLATDATSAARGAAKAAAEIASNIMKAFSIVSTAGAGATGIGIISEEQKLDRLLTEIGFTQEEKEAAFEFATSYRDFVSHSHELMQLTIDHQRAVQSVQNVLARGNRLLADREIFRQRSAAIIQGYRTRDVSFRLFRNESLEQYRSLFDLASRYSYLAAKSYDYETGLLGTSAGQAYFNKIVSSRALGDLTDGVPQLTTSAIGDSGLAGSMARLNADYSVANGRLGINNPDQNGTVFSLRTELYRIMQDDSLTSDEEAWRQTLEQHMVANVMADPDVANLCRNIRKPDGSAVPGIIIPFSTTIQHGKNFFGLDLAGGDHAFTTSNFATKVFSVGLALPGYVGMDTYAMGEMQAGAPASMDANALSATPYLYLVPCGYDFMLAPPLGDTNLLRSWKVQDQALPLPFNIGANDFNSTQFFTANGTLSEQPWITRKHQAFRAVSDASFFYGGTPSEFTNTRLIGRSVWNSQWKIVIPAYTLLANEQEGLNRFAASVQDVLLFLRTYSHSGN